MEFSSWMVTFIPTYPCEAQFLAVWTAFFPSLGSLGLQLCLLVSISVLGLGDGVCIFELSYAIPYLSLRYI